MARKKNSSPAENNQGIPGDLLAELDEYNNIVSAPTQEDLDDLDDMEAYDREQHHIAEKLVQKLAACFEETEKHFGPHEAKHCFEEFLKSPWVKQKLKRDRHRLSERDRKFSADYDAARKGEKESVILAFAAKNGMKFETAERTLRKAQAKDMGHLIRKWAGKS